LVSSRDVVDRQSVEDQLSADAAQLAELGYRQQLTRALGLFSNFSVGFTYLSPVVGVYALFAYGLATGGPAFFWSIPIVMAGQLLVVLTFAEVSSEYPLAGGIYQWARRLIGDRYAWLAGWMYTWALLVTIASVAFAAVLFIAPLFEYEITRTSTILTAVAIIAISAAINLTGVRSLARVAQLGFVAEIVGSLVIAVILLTTERHHGLGVLLETAGTGAGGYLGAFLAASLFSVWIFYGFEACGDVAEEVVDPSRKIPRAMMLTLFVGGLAAAATTLGYILAVPDFGAVVAGENVDPIGNVLAAALGEVGAKVALIMVLIAFISCTLAIQAAATRLVYSYARDGMIVGARALSTVSERFHIPPGAVAVAAIIPAAITLMPTATVARIITFAVVGIYVGFQSVVLAALIARARGWRPRGAFRLRPWGWFVNVAALVYGVAAIVIMSIETPALGESFIDRWLVPVSVGIVAAVGLLYLFVGRPKVRVREDARADIDARPMPGALPAEEGTTA
jgi:amino acid transporter